MFFVLFVCLFVFIVLLKMLFWPIFHCGMEIGKEVITTLKIFINHNFVKHPNSMVWMVCMLK